MVDFDQIMEMIYNGYVLELLKGQGVFEDLLFDFGVMLLVFVLEFGFWVFNFYIGLGKNKFLLYYDEIYSLFMMLEGRKCFILFFFDQSDCMYFYSFFSLWVLLENCVVDSCIDCQSFDLLSFLKFNQVRGVVGWLEEGQVLFILVGIWYFIEVEG